MNALPLDLLNHVFGYSNNLPVCSRMGKSQCDSLFDEYHEIISGQPTTFLYKKLTQMNPGLSSAKKVQGAIRLALEEVKKDRRFLPMWAQMNPPGKFDFFAINQQGALIEEARNVDLLRFVYGLRLRFPSALQFVEANGISDAAYTIAHQEKARLAREWLRENESVIFGVSEEEKNERVDSFLRRNLPVPKEYSHALTLNQQHQLLRLSVEIGSVDMLNALIDADSRRLVPAQKFEKALFAACLGNPIPYWRESFAGALIHSGRLSEISMNKIQEILLKTNPRTFEQLLGALILMNRFKEINWNVLGKRFEAALSWTVCWGYLSEFYLLYRNDRMARIEVYDLYMTLASAVYWGRDQVVAALAKVEKFERIDQKLLDSLLETAATYGYADIVLILFKAGGLSQDALVKALTGAAKSGKNGTLSKLVRHVEFSAVSADVLGEAIWSAVVWENEEGLKIILRNLDPSKILFKEIENHKKSISKEKIISLLKGSQRH